jgi:hypothetical protein
MMIGTGGLSDFRNDVLFEVELLFRDWAVLGMDVARFKAWNLST